MDAPPGGWLFRHFAVGMWKTRMWRIYWHVGLWMSKPLGGELNGHLAYERVNPHYMIIHPCVLFFSCNYFHIAPTGTSQSLHGGLKLLSCTIRNPRRRRTTFQLDLSLKNIQSLHDPLTQGRKGIIYPNFTVTNPQRNRNPRSEM